MIINAIIMNKLTKSCSTIVYDKTYMLHFVNKFVRKRLYTRVCYKKLCIGRVFLCICVPDVLYWDGFGTVLGCGAHFRLCGVVTCVSPFLYENVW